MFCVVPQDQCESVRDAQPPDGGSAVLEVERSGAAAVVRLRGELTGAAGHQLVETLDWMTAEGARCVTVLLVSAKQVDSAWLEALRAARMRMGVALSVTAGGA